MYTWLAPWLYVGVVGICFLLGNSCRPAMVERIRALINVILSLALILVVMGILGVVFWKAKALHVATWVLFLAITGWTIWALTRTPTTDNSQTPPTD